MESPVPLTDLFLFCECCLWKQTKHKRVNIGASGFFVVVFFFFFFLFVCLFVFCCCCFFFFVFFFCCCFFLFVCFFVENSTVVCKTACVDISLNDCSVSLINSFLSTTM